MPAAPPSTPASSEVERLPRRDEEPRGVGALSRPAVVPAAGRGVALRDSVSGGRTGVDSGPRWIAG